MKTQYKFLLVYGSFVGVIAVVVLLSILGEFCAWLPGFCDSAAQVLLG